MGMPEQSKDLFTYGDYASWPDEERWELIDGQPFAMTPAPTVRHQQIAIRLGHQLVSFFEGKPCQALQAPVDVLLPQGNEADEEIVTVVQPDLLVVCDPAKIDEKGVRGAPDMTIEILSNATAHRDLGEKLFLYEKHGVRCYLIVDPWGKTCTLRLLEAPGRFGRPQTYTSEELMPIDIFPGLSFDLSRVFA